MILLTLATVKKLGAHFSRWPALSQELMSLPDAQLEKKPFDVRRGVGGGGADEGQEAKEEARIETRTGSQAEVGTREGTGSQGHRERGLGTKELYEGKRS